MGTGASERVTTSAAVLHRLALILVIAVGVALRSYAYDWEVGNKYTHDTGDKISQSLRVASGHFEPKNWKQPYFLPYATGAIVALADSVRPVDYDGAKRIAALLMVALSSGTILLVARLAWLASKDGRVTLLATALFAVVPLSAVGSRYIKEDVPVTFWVTLALIAILHARAAPSMRSYGLLGLSLGAAIGTKFSALLLVPAALSVHATGVARGKRPNLLRHTVVAGAAAVLAFCLFNPFAISRPGELLEGISFQARYAGGAHHDGTEVDPWSQLWSFYLRKAVFPGLTPVAAVFALAGIVQAVRRRKTPDAHGFWLLAVWIALVYFAAEASSAKPYPFFARYLQPIAGSLCVLSAWSVVSFISYVKIRHSRPVLLFAAGTILTATVAWPAALSAIVVAGAVPDTRAVAAAWMTASLPHGAKIGLDNELYSPPVDPLRFDVTYFGLIRDRLRTKQMEKLRRDGFSYIVLNSFMTGRFHETADYSEAAKQAERFYVDLENKYPLVREFRPPLSLQTYGFHNPVIRIYDIRPRHAGK